MFLQKTWSAFMGRGSFDIIQLGGLGQVLINKYHITTSPEFCCTRQMMLFLGEVELHICNLSDMHHIFACIQQLRSLKWFKTVSSQHPCSFFFLSTFSLIYRAPPLWMDQQKKKRQNKFEKRVVCTKSQAKGTENGVQVRWLSRSKGSV